MLTGEGVQRNVEKIEPIGLVVEFVAGPDHFDGRRVFRGVAEDTHRSHTRRCGDRQHRLAHHETHVVEFAGIEGKTRRGIGYRHGLDDVNPSGIGRQVNSERGHDPMIRFPQSEVPCCSM